MPEIVQPLHFKKSGEWRPKVAETVPEIGFCRFGICAAWLGRQYILDKAKPVNMVFSTDLEAEDAYLVKLGQPDVFSSYLRVLTPGGKRSVQTCVAGYLRRFVEKLQKDWGQDRIAIWFEQDWQEGA